MEVGGGTGRGPMRPEGVVLDTIVKLASSVGYARMKDVLSVVEQAGVDRDYATAIVLECARAGGVELRDRGRWARVRKAGFDGNPGGGATTHVPREWCPNVRGSHASSWVTLV